MGGTPFFLILRKTKNRELLAESYLGLIEDEKQLLKMVIQGRKFAEATGHPIRYIDIVFVLYGQMSAREVGLEKGICLEANPNCSICGVQNYCDYYVQNVAAKSN